MKKVMVLGDVDSPHVLKWSNGITKFGNNSYEIKLVDVEFAKGNSLFLAKLIRLLLLYIKSLILLFKFRPDIVHAHYASSYGLIVSMLPVRKIIVSAWGSDILQYKDKGVGYLFMLRFVLWRSYKVFADSNDLIKNCQLILNNDEKYILINWGIDLGLIKKSNHAFSKFKFISVRNFEDIYNISTIVKAFEIAVDETEGNIEIEIYGKGSRQKEIESLISKSKSKKYIIYKGYDSLSNIYESFSNSNCFITIPNSDGTSSSLLEAMAAGLFVICSDLPANREWISENNGSFLKEINAEQLAFLMIKTFKLEIEYLKKISMENRCIIESRANQKIEFNKALNVYKTITDF